MPRKKMTEVAKEEIDYSKIKENIRDEKVSDVLRSNFMPYSMSVIVSRAIPEIDGLKPSHRKVLYTMYLMGLLNGPRSKSANIAGQVLKLNPHSDAAAYETMVRLTDDNETLLAPVVDSKGNMGKHYSRDMAFSASRYCVTGDTLIPTSKGTIRIQDIVMNSKEDSENDINIDVKSYNKKNNKAIKFFNSGKHLIYSIELENGQKLKGTPNHPILVKYPDGTIDWKLLEDIKEGDECLIDLDTSNSLFGTNSDNLEARMLACIIAKGAFKDDYVEIKDKNKHMILPFFAYGSTTAPNASKSIEKVEDAYRYSIKNKEWVNELLEMINFQDEDSKVVPQKVFCGTKEYQKYFFQYLFEGLAFVKEGEKIILSNKSENLVRETQIMLCTSFGIYSEVLFNKKTKNWELEIPQNYLKKFSDEIGFVSERKNNILFDKTKKDLSCYYENIPYKFVKVLTKKQDGMDIVYSLKVDSECHSFSGNGFINHNTEAKLSKISEEFFKGINKDAVDFVDNYDSTMKEPKLLPVTFPNILANPNQGIAVGMASNICSFNLKELCDATILHIKKPKADIMEVMKGPDFTTGAKILFEKEVMEQIYNTGKGSIKMQAKYKIDKKNNIIEILEIPYSTTIEQIIEGVVDLIKKGKIKEINDIRDEIDKDGFKIAIDYKRNCDPELLMKKLYKMTKLQDSFGCNFNVLIDGRPKTLGVYAILDEWIKWRKTCINREYSFDLKKKEHDLHLLKGLEKIFLNLTKVIKIIRETENDDEVIPNLMSSFKIDEEQATYIADIKLRNLNKEYILNKTKSIPTLESEIENIKNVIGNDKELNKVIIKQLTEIGKKYGKPRKTEIVDYVEEEFVYEEVVDDYPLTLYRTKEGYIKKIPATSLKTSPEIKLKEDDQILQQIETTNKTEIIFFTNKCNVYKIYAKDIKDCKPSDFGEYYNNLFECDRDEEIIYMCPINYGTNVVIGFENGKIAKYPLNNYETKNNRKKIIKAFYNGSKVLNIFVINDDEIFGITNSKGKLLAVNSKDIPLKTIKTTQGIQAIRLPKDSVATEFKRISDFNLKSMTGFGYKSLPAPGGTYKSE